MAWSYDPTNLNTTTASGRTNTVRLLVGDTDTSDQLVQNEEISFALKQNGDNVYTTAAWVCRVIASKFARLVDTQLDGALEVNYSDRAKQYTALAFQMDSMAKKNSGRALGVFAGGISKVQVEIAETDPDRVKPAFKMGQFSNPSADPYPSEG